MNDNAANRWRRQKALFQEALERGPAERVQLLAEAHGEDAELAREVEAMLAAHGEGEGFLAEPFVAPAAPARHDAWLGEVLEGKYRV